MPMFSIIHISILLIFGGLLLAAAAEDIRHYIVPNRLCLGIVALYPSHIIAAPYPVDWIGGLAVVGASLLVGLVIFARGYAGGGDVKLFTAVALWAGPEHFKNFLLITSLAGLAIGVAMLARRWIARRSAVALADSTVAAPSDEGSVEQRPAPSLSDPLPYGVAIAAGGLAIAIPLITGG